MGLQLQRFPIMTNGLINLAKILQGIAQIVVGLWCLGLKDQRALQIANCLRGIPLLPGNHAQ
nr:hypothetical protein [Synechococcus sp. Nb3U1]